MFVPRNNTQEKEAIRMEVSQIPKSCPSTGPKRIQLWRSKVITIINEKVCAVNSPGVHTLRPVRGLCCKEEMPWHTRAPRHQSLPRPDPQHGLSRSLRRHLLVKMFPKEMLK